MDALCLAAFAIMATLSLALIAFCDALEKGNLP